MCKVTSETPSPRPPLAALFVKPLIQKLLANQVFRYGIAAGTATVVDVLTYYLLVNFVIHSDVHLLGLTGTPHSVSLLISYSLGLITNFLITKFFVFQNSDLKTGTQFFRFALVAVVVFWANKYAMEGLYWLVPQVIDLQPKPLSFVVRSISALGIGVLSFISHKLFSFRQAAPAVESQTDSTSGQ